MTAAKETNCDCIKAENELRTGNAHCCVHGRSSLLYRGTQSTQKRVVHGVVAMKKEDAIGEGVLLRGSWSLWWAWWWMDAVLRISITLLFFRTAWTVGRHGYCFHDYRCYDDCSTSSSYVMPLARWEVSQEPWEQRAGTVTSLIEVAEVTSSGILAASLL